MPRKRVAVVGAGVSGLGAAWLLARGGYSVTLFEAASRAGGHARTLDLDVPGFARPVPVDVGFIVYNTRTYPDFVSLLELLRVPQDNSCMSFAASVDLPEEVGGGGGSGGVSPEPFEWGSDSLGALFAGGRNLSKGAIYVMLWDMRRFNTAVYAFVQHVETYPESPEAAYTLADFLAVGGYSPIFVNAYLIPMVSAVWSASFQGALQFPARALLRFFVNHGLAQVFARPQWRTPLRRSRDYVAAVLADFVVHGGVVRLGTRVDRVVRSLSSVELTVSHADTREGPDERDGKGDDGDVDGVGGDGGGNDSEADESLVFDQVVFATHADNTLAILGNGASAEERRILGAFKYSANTGYVHTDQRLMPTARVTWSAWNFIQKRAAFDVVRSGNSDGAATPDEPHDESHVIESRPVCVTYWLNKLQNLNSLAHHELTDLFLTLNPCVPIDPSKVLAEMRYEHPQFTDEAVSAQAELQNVIQGENRTWFCGAFARYGFHEDGLMSGLDVAERLSRYKVLRPWRSKAALAINNNYRLYELPFAAPRCFGIAYLSSLLVINLVVARVHVGLSKYAERLSQSDASVVLSDGLGLLLFYGQTSPDLTKPGLVNVRSPRLLVRITEAIRHRRELAPMAVSAFVSGEFDVPTPSDLTSVLQALIVAQRRGPELGHGFQGQIRLAETLLHALVGGFEPPRPPIIKVRVPGLGSIMDSILFPCWWESENVENRARALEVASLGSALTEKAAVSAVELPVSRAGGVLELTGNLCESTVGILRANPSWCATIAVLNADHVPKVRNKAKLWHIFDRIRVIPLAAFLSERISPLDSEQSERYDHVVSPCWLNLCQGVFDSISQAMSYMYDVLKRTGGIAELGFTACDEQRVQGNRRKRNSDEMFAGRHGFRMRSTREVLAAADFAGFRLDELKHMDATDAVREVDSKIQHVLSKFAESLSASEVRETLGQCCLWQAALAVGIAQRTVVVLRKPTLSVSLC